MNRKITDGEKPNSYHPGMLNLLRALVKETLCGVAIVVIIAVPAVVLKIIVKLYEAREWSDEWIVIGLYGFAYFIFAIDLLVAASIVTALGYRISREVWK